MRAQNCECLEVGSGCRWAGGNSSGGVNTLTIRLKWVQLPWVVKDPESTPKPQGPWGTSPERTESWGDLSVTQSQSTVTYSRRKGDSRTGKGSKDSAEAKPCAHRPYGALHRHHLTPRAKKAGCSWWGTAGVNSEQRHGVPQKQRAGSTSFSHPQPRPLHAELSPGLTAARLCCRSLGDRHHDDSADASPDLGTRRRTTEKSAPPEEGALPRQPHLFLEWLTHSLRHLVRHLTRLLVAKQVI